MGNPGNRYLWRPDPRGPIYIRFTYHLPGNGRAHRFVRSLRTNSYPEARRIRDRAFMPLVTSLRCAQTARDLVRFVVKTAEGIVDRDLSLFTEGIGTERADVSEAADREQAQPADPVGPKTNGGPTWGALSKVYLDSVRARRTEATFVKYAGQIKFLDGFFGKNTPARQIDRRRVALLLEFMEERDSFGDTTINSYLSLVGAIFRFGVSRGLVEVNPAMGVRIEVVSLCSYQ